VKIKYKLAKAEDKLKCLSKILMMIKET